MKMTKQNKMLLGVGAIAIATYLVFKNKKKSFANAGGRSGTFTLPAGSKCPKPYLTVQGITSNAPITCVPPKTTYSGGGGIFIEPKNTPPPPPQVPSTTPIGVNQTPIPGIPPPKGFM
jgi:hypothetical protein